MFRKFLVFFFSVSFCSLGACPDSKTISYPQAVNQIDTEIDVLLDRAEQLLFFNEFKEALFWITRAEALLPLTDDEDHYRILRLSFDKAITSTCMSGPSIENQILFRNLEDVLFTKCKNNKQPENLFDKNGNWPIFGPDVMSQKDCLDAVENTTALAMIALTKLAVNKATAFAIESAIYAIGRKAKQCCTENGFWKTCIQPVVDVWKRMDILRIPPDPYWD